MLITQDGYHKLQNEINHLMEIEIPLVAKKLEETRPFGVSDEFPPEYLQALEEMDMFEKKIASLNEIYQNSNLYNKSMIQDINKIYFGATVKLLNNNNDKEVVYTIVSSYESDISKGLISVESPLVKEMLGLMVEDYFEVNGIEYTILEINYLI